jgi:hypothetical protein
LDETSGKLEHVTTDPNDTTVVIQLNDLTEKYFRVFVLNQYGLLGGSNIEKIISVSRNLIKGGSFDFPTDVSQWIYNGRISIDNVDFYEGSGSLLLKCKLDTVNYSYSSVIEMECLTDNLMYTGISLEKNIDYRISFWYKLSGFSYMMQPFFYYYLQENERKIYTLVSNDWPGTWITLSPFKILDDTGWVYYSTTFYSDSDKDAVFYLGSQLETVRIDNLEIKVAPK